MDVTPSTRHCTVMASFTANGLLGSAPPLSSEHYGVTEPNSNDFAVEKSLGTLEDVNYAGRMSSS